MQLVPQIEPITRMARDHKALVDKLANGPVVLSSHSKAAAVMVSVQTWNQMVKRLQQYDEAEVTRRNMLEADANPDAELTLDEFMADLD